jgi:hypothetical protein
LVLVVAVLGIMAVTAAAWRMWAVWRPSSLENYAAAAEVDGYRRTHIEKRSDYLIATYWVGPPVADIIDIVSAPHVVWKERLGPPSSLNGFSLVADATARGYSEYCAVQAFRIDEEFWAQSDRDILEASQSLWGLRYQDAEAVQSGDLDLIAIAVDSC